MEKTPYTISKVTRAVLASRIFATPHEQGTIHHQRINAKPGKGYWLSVKYKDGNTNKVEAKGGVENLISKIEKDIRLTKECPGSKVRPFLSSLLLIFPSMLLSSLRSLSMATATTLSLMMMENLPLVIID